MRTRKLLKRSMMAAAAMLAVPGVLLAQDMDPEGYDDDPVDTGEATIDLEGRAGVAIPAADFMEFTDYGFSGGAGAALWLHDNLAVRADADYARLNGETEGLVAEASTPDVSLFHYGMGVEFDVPGRSSGSLWDFEINAGVGGTVFDTADFLDDVAEDEEQDITETYPNVNAGFAVGRQVADDVLVNVSTQAFYTFLNENELSNLSDLRVTETLDDGVSVPVTLTVRYDLPGIG